MSDEMHEVAQFPDRDSAEEGHARSSSSEATVGEPRLERGTALSVLWWPDVWPHDDASA